MKSVFLRSVVTAGAVLLSAMALAPSSAQAIPITGDISFAGNWQPLDGLGTPTTIDLAKQVDIIGDSAVVLSTSGDFASVAPFSTAVYNDFVIDPFIAVIPLWSVGGFTFDLTSIAIDTQTSTTLGLVGSGVLKAAGFDDTAGAYSFSGDGTNMTFAFSSTSNTSALAIPEPESLVLLGLGLLVLGFAARRRSRAL